ncbi:MAG TPA: hypothetical protein DEF00_03030 [Candidatus Taylorbacteria bacterium]|nr:MAG: hypothetical protein UY03_C0003G0017 [Parcubacteria group bacterium GW2011_GWA2_47_64]KKU96804.1 MAG: hypothetical protein UY29_C0006G0013 [Parcubacteria group bacterium GW2011_GWC2_48_17]HBV01339.1 hypothetical protein [Candidatus Taylorbacteria bacterium]
MHYKLAAFAFLALISLGAQSLFAQTGTAGTELSMMVFPEHPRPGDAIVVSVESYNIDLNRADMRWFINNKLVKAGVGEKSLETVASRAGEFMEIRVAALGENGSVYSASISFRPAEVNLLWQTESYTPPFYKGKALMPYQGTVLVAAVPSFTRGGRVMSSESLIYTWKEGDDVIGDSSGKGKSLFVFRGSVPIRAKTISVLVESPDRTMAAEASVDIVPVAPRLLFYEEHPLYGLLLSKALIGNFLLKGDETRISALPFYFETDTKSNKDILYDWQLNYQELPNERGPALTLRRIVETAGKSNLFLEARSADENKLFQTAEERLTIEFPEKSSF